MSKVGDGLITEQELIEYIPKSVFLSPYYTELWPKFSIVGDGLLCQVRG